MTSEGNSKHSGSGDHSQTQPQSQSQSQPESQTHVRATEGTNASTGERNKRRHSRDRNHHGDDQNTASRGNGGEGNHQDTDQTKHHKSNPNHGHTQNQTYSQKRSQTPQRDRSGSFDQVTSHKKKLLAWPNTASEAWDMTKTACTACTDFASSAWTTIQNNVPSKDDISRLKFTSNPSIILRRAMQHPSRLTAALEAAGILFVMGFATWFLFYFALAIVAFEVVRRGFYAAKIEKTASDSPSGKSLELVGPYASPKNIFITGASSGIGEQLALYYSRCGVQRLYLVARNRERLEAVAKACKQLAGAHIVVQTMVADVNNAKLMHSTITDANSRTPLDLIIANAGIGVSTMDKNASWDDQVRSMTNTNIQGVLNTILPVIPIFKDRRKGQIAVISSMAGISGVPGNYHYGATKAYLNAFGQGIRADLAQYGVSYVTICPGYVLSRLTEERHKKYRFGLPFMVDGDDGARRIAMSIADDTPFYMFPAPMHAVAWFFRSAPYALMDAIYSVGRRIGMDVSSIH